MQMWGNGKPLKNGRIGRQVLDALKPFLQNEEDSEIVKQCSLMQKAIESTNSFTKHFYRQKGSRKKYSNDNPSFWAITHYPEPWAFLKNDKSGYEDFKILLGGLANTDDPAKQQFYDKWKHLLLNNPTKKNTSGKMDEDLENGENLWVTDDEKLKEMFQEFRVYPYETKTVLGGAMVIACKEFPVTLMARLCPSGDFEKISAKLDEVHGPMVDVHLKKPTEKLPPGVQIGIKHFLAVPSCPEVREAWEEDNHEHHFLKVTKTKKGRLNIEIIDTFKEVTSNFFITEKLQNQSLCQLAVGLSFKRFSFMRKPTCSHNSPKSFVLTQAKGRCPHREHSLFLWCVCDAVDDERFNKEITENNHKKSYFRKKLNELSTASDTFYEVSVKLSEGGEWDIRQRVILKCAKKTA